MEQSIVAISLPGLWRQELPAPLRQPLALVPARTIRAREPPAGDLTGSSRRRRAVFLTSSRIRFKRLFSLREELQETTDIAGTFGPGHPRRHAMPATTSQHERPSIIC